MQLDLSVAENATGKRSVGDRVKELGEPRYKSIANYILGLI